MAELRQLEFVTSSRGTPQILLDGFLYSKSTTRRTAQHWRCVNKTCKGKCTTVGDVLRNVSDHTHPQEDVNHVRFLSATKGREETTQMHTIYDYQVSPEDPTHLPTLPSFSSMISALYRHRRKTIPVLPQTRAEVDLEDDWTRTTDDEHFLLVSDGEENKILAFSTDWQCSTRKILKSNSGSGESGRSGTSSGRSSS